MFLSQPQIVKYALPKYFQINAGNSNSSQFWNKLQKQEISEISKKNRETTRRSFLKFQTRKSRKVKISGRNPYRKANNNKTLKSSIKNKKTKNVRSTRRLLDLLSTLPSGFHGEQWQDILPYELFSHLLSRLSATQQMRSLCKPSSPNFEN